MIPRFLGADTIYRDGEEQRLSGGGGIIMTFILDVFRLTELLDTQVSGSQLNL